MTVVAEDTAAARVRPAGAVPRRPWAAVAREVAADRIDRAVFVVVAGAVGFGYSILLPFDYTQRIAFANWQYFDVRYVVFDVAFALAMAFVITLQVHAMRRVVANARVEGGRRGGLGGVLAAIVSLAPSFLCCSPIVPTLVGVLGLSAATRLRTTGTVTGFFATKQNLLLGAALVLLLGSGLWSMRKLARARCLDGSCADELSCEAPDAAHTGAGTDLAEAGAGSLADAVRVGAMTSGDNRR